MPGLLYSHSYSPYQSTAREAVAVLTQLQPNLMEFSTCRAVRINSSLPHRSW